MIFQGDYTHQDVVCDAQIFKPYEVAPSSSDRIIQ
jgi:hypothetical protein